MPKWIQKTIVVLVTVLTFGLVTPTELFELVDDKPPKRDAIQSKNNQERSIVENQINYDEQDDSEIDVINSLIKDAEQYSYEKFGNRIKPLIEDEFKEIILPNIEKAIEAVAYQYDDHQLKNLIISEAPTGGHSEKIFHIADREKEQDVIRFHVRKDHPPQSGYWFNFHYHTVLDDFQEHHDLGSIYWDKNTPPKWMS